MKKLRSLTYMIAVLPFIALIIFFSACTKEGPMGPAGKSGTDGLNGKDANASCLVCHTVANWTAKTDQYHSSKHFYGTSSARNTKYCARCHTNEGFQEITGAGKFVVSNDIPNGTRISCETCHKMGGFDYSDTLSEILRTTTPIFLNYNKNLTSTDFGKINNLCCTCHQIRGATSVNYTDSLGKVQPFTQLPFFPFLATKDDLATVKYQVGQSFSVHDGNQ